MWDIRLELIPSSFCIYLHALRTGLTIVTESYQIAFTTKCVFGMAAMFTRMSLMLFYYRLVKDSGMHKYRMVIHASQVFSVIVGVFIVFLTIWQCKYVCFLPARGFTTDALRPIKAFWTFPMMEGAHCLDEGKITLGAGIVNCAADLWTAILPIPLIARLQMPFRRRVGVMVLLSLGFIVVITGGIRSYFVWYSLIRTYDMTWYCYPLWICAAVEIDLAVVCSEISSTSRRADYRQICACAPSFRLLVAAMTGRYMPTVRSGYASSFGGSRVKGQSGGGSKERGYNISAPSAILSQQSGTLVESEQDYPNKLWSSPYTGYATSPPPKYDGQEIPLVDSNQRQFDRRPYDYPTKQEPKIETTIEADTISRRESEERAPSDESRSSNNSYYGIRPGGLHGDIHVQRNVHVTSSPQNTDPATARVLDRYAVEQRERTMRHHDRITSLGQKSF